MTKLTRRQKPRAKRPRPSLKARTGKVVSDASASILGAGVGLAIGGLLGALTGAATGPIAKYAAAEVAEQIHHFWGRFVKRLSAQGITEEDFVASIERDPDRRAAFLAILRAAAASIDPVHLRVLADSAATLADADSRRSAAIAQIATILTSLNPLHIRALLFIQMAGQEAPNSLGVTPEQLISTFDSELPLIRSIVRTLELHGLIVDNARLDGAIKGVYWELTDIGNWLLSAYGSEHPTGHPAPKHFQTTPTGGV